MSKNENLTEQHEQQMSAIFARLKEIEAEPSPYLKTRVLAHLNEEKKYKGSLFFWKLVSAGSLFSLIFLSIFSFKIYREKADDVLVKQAYVIHVDFDQNDKGLVAGAEIELPGDVYFVTSNKDIRGEKKLKLPVSVKESGRGKLPFVVTSDSTGEKLIKVRLFNEKDELVREQILNVKFAKQGSTVVF